ncbi:MAG: class I SAM-dependent methyltransferase [Patescibacteria group bacterium]
MSKRFNTWNQTRVWEEDCVKTRRSISQRTRRLKFFKIKKSDYILDLGCGDGLNISILRKMGKKKIVGIDISEELLREARKANPDVKVLLASAEKIPFKENTFDVVLVDSVFHHLMRYGKTLKEIKRVLKPGGKLCFSEPHKSIFRTMYDYFSISPFAKFIPFFRERGKAYLGEVKFMKHWLATEDDFCNQLKEIGFIEKLHKIDILSVIGIYEKPKD